MEDQHTGSAESVEPDSTTGEEPLATVAHLPTAATRSMLMSERFVAVFPSLIRAIGAEAAIVLQYLNFTMAEKDGKVTIANLSQETGLSERTVRRRLKWLADEGIIESAQPDAYDRTKTYRINHGHPALSPCGQPGHMEAANLATSQPANLAASSTTPRREEAAAEAPDPLEDLSASEKSDFWGWLRRERRAMVPRALYRHFDAGEKAEAVKAFRDSTYDENAWMNSPRQPTFCDDCHQPFDYCQTHGCTLWREADVDDAPNERTPHR